MLQYLRAVFWAVWMRVRWAIITCSIPYAIFWVHHQHREQNQQKFRFVRLLLRFSFCLYMIYMLYFVPSFYSFSVALHSSDFRSLTVRWVRWNTENLSFAFCRCECVYSCDDERKTVCLEGLFDFLRKCYVIIFYEVDSCLFYACVWARKRERERETAGLSKRKWVPFVLVWSHSRDIQNECASLYNTSMPPVHTHSRRSCVFHLFRCLLA